jgi:hypothetical protein
VRDDRTERHRRSVEGDTPPPEPRKVDFSKNKIIKTDYSRMKAREENNRNRIVMNFRPINHRQVNHLIRVAEHRIQGN